MMMFENFDRSNSIEDVWEDAHFVNDVVLGGGDYDDDSCYIGSSDIEEGDGSGIDISILFNTPQVYS